RRGTATSLQQDRGQPLRLSTCSCRWHWRRSWRARCPWCRDVVAAVAVTSDRNRERLKQHHVAFGGPPSRRSSEETPSEVCPVDTDVTLPQPSDHSAPGIGAEVSEGAGGHAAPEVVTPSPQHPIEDAEQVGQRAVLRSAGV